MKLRGALAPVDGTKSGNGSRGKGGLNTVGSPAVRTKFSSDADTVVSIERKVVSGHAYAILASTVAECGRRE
jgi:hypothetical protein